MTNKIIHKGRLIELHSERVDYSNGHTYFDIVKHPGGAVIAAINDRNEICLLKQWRHAIEQNIWELPAGCLEAGEEPLYSAQRELEEEAAVVAKKWKELGVVCSTPGFCNEILHLFEARDLSKGTLNLDDAEQLEAHWVPIDKAYEMCADGSIIDAKTLACLLKLKLA